jgi:hypothetical protein
MFNNRKENDNNLHEIIDNEQLIEDCNNAKKYSTNIGLEYIRRDAIKQYNELEKEFLHNNLILSFDEKLLVKKVFKFLKDRA